MTWFFVVVIVLVLGAAVVVAFGRGARTEGAEVARPGGVRMGEAYDDRPDVVVPADRPLGPDDLDRVRFTTAVRGYRMDEVDALLARLRTELAARERSDPGLADETEGDDRVG
ncbi:MAG: DivIVA domain-containing protein [Nocardioidaceae bacterium]